MGRDTYICTIDYVVKRIGENLELLEEIAGNSDNIDYGEMIDVVTGPDKTIIAFTSRGIENLQEFIVDVRTSQGGMRQFLIEQNCDPEMIERIMADELRWQPGGYVAPVRCWVKNSVFCPFSRPRFLGKAALCARRDLLRFSEP